MLSISDLAKKLNKEQQEVALFLKRAPNKYKVYKIPKRSFGFRIIAQPSRELKEYQRAFVQLAHFPVHSCAMAYREGLGIKENAAAHSSSPYLLKIDLENFFNSITPSVFWKACERSKVAINDIEKNQFEQLLFWNRTKKATGKLMLSVGAPSSPYISNFCMFEFDTQLADHCANRNITYTRYADDLTFSCKNKGELFHLPSYVNQLLEIVFDGCLKVNTNKTVFSSKAHNRHVTGVTINNEGNLSLGRRRKRYIKHMINEYKHNVLSAEDIEHLRGVLAFASHIEPSLITTLEKKYSKELLDRLTRNGHV